MFSNYQKDHCSFLNYFYNNLIHYLKHFKAYELMVIAIIDGSLILEVLL